VDPDASAVELALQSDGIVDDHLPREKHPGKGVTERDGLNGVADLGGRLFTPFDSLQLGPGMMADRPSLAGTILPAGAVGQGHQLEREAIEGGPRRRGDRFPWALEEPIDLVGHLSAEQIGNLPIPPDHTPSRIGVGSAADRDHRLTAGMPAFEMVDGVPGPVAADHRVGERDTVTGVGGEQAAEPAVRFLDHEDREVVVDRPAGGAAIEGEAEPAGGVGKHRRSAVCEGHQGDLFEFGLQNRAVGEDAGPAVGGNRLTEQGVCTARDHRRRVRVRGAECESRATDPVRGQPGGDPFGERVGNPECFHGDHDDGVGIPLRAGDGDGTGHDALPHPLRLPRPPPESVETDRHLGRDVDLCKPHAERRLGCEDPRALQGRTSGKSENPDRERSEPVAEREHGISTPGPVVSIDVESGPPSYRAAVPQKPPVSSHPAARWPGILRRVAAARSLRKA
jgi:hypothetical protein